MGPVHESVRVPGPGEAKDTFAPPENVLGSTVK